MADAPEETTGADGSGDNIQVFASSLDFEAAMAEQYPEVLLYEPPESFTAQWNLQQILLLADEKTPFYTQQFSREDAQAGTETVEIQVYFLNSYTSAEEGFQDFFQTAGGYTLASAVDQGCCIRHSSAACSAASPRTAPSSTGWMLPAPMHRAHRPDFQKQS